MPGPDRIILHLPISVGGTLVVASPVRYRSDYEAALRRYHGPAHLVLCDEAFTGTKPEMARMRRSVALNTPCDVPYSLPIPGFFSLHCLNPSDLPKGWRDPFWQILDDVQADAEGPAGMTQQETLTWFGLALTACAVGVVAWVLLGALWQYFTTS